MSVHHVHTPAEYNKLLETAGKLVIVDFSASWCPPCRMFAPIFESMAAKYPGVIFIHVDVDELDSLPHVQGVTGVPTFMYFKGGKKVDEFSGASQDRFEKTLKKHM
eukprot:TRINITY_DN4858_c0_g1_i1.p1 TRINITY_DN4858_c0_g1~~TRINITY_DN4858_c0_g1_i1.p1  ORF type:complete len:106 (+),score=28.42 TRINITY_DN4858_c0_g1_i1:131-448(+)